MMRRDVIAEPVLTLALFQRGVRITLVGRLLGNFGTEDLVNCVSIGT